jgi:hyperosmotically inducible protein
MKKQNFTNSCILSVLMLFSATAFAGEVSDSVITGKIESKIALDNSVSVFDVDVNTDHGVVTLAGNVDSDNQASTLIQIAESTAGVKDVKANKLRVKQSENPFTDTAITAKVKGIFVREKLFGDEDVSPMTLSVETKNGVVYLTGSAESKHQVSRAVALAKTIKGVKAVRANVNIG